MSCEECGVPLRPKRTPDPGDGSQEHGGHGRCNPCYQATRKRTAAPPEHLTAYLTARRRRKKITA